MRVATTSKTDCKQPLADKPRCPTIPYLHTPRALKCMYIFRPTTNPHKRNIAFISASRTVEQQEIRPLFPEIRAFYPSFAVL